MARAWLAGSRLGQQIMERSTPHTDHAVQGGQQISRQDVQMPAHLVDSSQANSTACGLPKTQVLLGSWLVHASIHLCSPASQNGYHCSRGPTCPHAHRLVPVNFRRESHHAHHGLYSNYSNRRAKIDPSDKRTTADSVWGTVHSWWQVPISSPRSFPPTFATNSTKFPGGCFR
jgi:hypothetical protein